MLLSLDHDPLPQEAAWSVADSDTVNQLHCSGMHRKDGLTDEAYLLFPCSFSIT
jgi:hypothetical protein